MGIVCRNSVFSVAPRMCWWADKEEYKIIYLLWIYSCSFFLPSPLKWKVKDKIVKYYVMQTTENWVHRQFLSIEDCAPAQSAQPNAISWEKIRWGLFTSTNTHNPLMSLCCILTFQPILVNSLFALLLFLLLRLIISSFPTIQNTNFSILSARSFPSANMMQKISQRPLSPAIQSSFSSIYVTLKFLEGTFWH